MDSKRFASFLGWFGIGLGLAQLLAPERVARLAGMHLSPSAMRLLGAREVASGIAILANDRPVAPVWARVLGDVMDLGVLNAQLADPRADHGRVAAAAFAVAGVTALDAACSQQLR